MMTWPRKPSRKYADLTPEGQAYVDEFSDWVDAQRYPMCRAFGTGMLTAAATGWFTEFWQALAVCAVFMALTVLGLSWGTARWVTENPPPPTWPGRDG